MRPTRPLKILRLLKLLITRLTRKNLNINRLPLLQLLNLRLHPIPLSIQILNLLLHPRHEQIQLLKRLLRLSQLQILIFNLRLQLLELDHLLPLNFILELIEQVHIIDALIDLGFELRHAFLQKLLIRLQFLRFDTQLRKFELFMLSDRLDRPERLHDHQGDLKLLLEEDKLTLIRYNRLS